MRFKAARVVAFALLASSVVAQGGGILDPGQVGPGATTPGPSPSPTPPPQTTANPVPTTSPVEQTTNNPQPPATTSGGNPQVPTETSRPNPGPNTRPTASRQGPSTLTTAGSGTVTSTPTGDSKDKDKDSGSSTDTLKTAAIVVGAVIIAAAIGIWVFRKWKLSPSRDFQSKIRGDDYQDYPRPYENDTMHLRQLGEQTPGDTNSVGAAKSPYTGGGAELAHNDDQYYDPNYAKDQYGPGGSTVGGQYAAHDGYDQGYGHQGGYDQGGYGGAHHDGYYDNFNQGGGGGYAASQVGGYAPSQVGGYSQGGGGGGYGNTGGYGYDHQYGGR